MNAVKGRPLFIEDGQNCSLQAIHPLSALALDGYEILTCSESASDEDEIRAT
jgi:hypothetical protein